MKKFLVLYRSTVSPMDTMASADPERTKVEMDKWTAWGASAGTALADWGAPLGESAVLQGRKSSDYLTGFSIVQVDSLEAAKGLFDEDPHLGAPADSIELLEMLPMPGA